MTRTRKRIIIAVQLAAIALITFQYLQTQTALAGMLKLQSTAVQEEFNELVAEGIITLAPTTDPVSPAQRIWHRVFENDDYLAEKFQSWWQPVAVLLLIVNLILVGCIKTRPRESGLSD